MLKKYKITLANNEIRHVIRKWTDFFFDVGKWGWAANRFHDATTNKVVWISKHFTIEVEEE